MNDLNDIIDRCKETSEDLHNIKWNLIQLIDKLNDYKVIEQDINKLRIAKGRIALGLTQYQDEFDFYLARILGEM